MVEVVGGSYEHRMRFTLVYENGWENGSYEANTTSDCPSRCARMVLARFAGGSVVGVRILSIDERYVDYLLLEGWIKDEV